jgi:hypothetical protein
MKARIILSSLAALLAILFVNCNSVSAQNLRNIKWQVQNPKEIKYSIFFVFDNKSDTVFSEVYDLCELVTSNSRGKYSIKANTINMSFNKNENHVYSIKWINSEKIMLESPAQTYIMCISGSDEDHYFADFRAKYPRTDSADNY